jgi:ATP-independent RNA helicase DbpA
MTPIQQRALPPILAGRDVVAQAKTGSGKTAAFGLGLLQELDTEAGRAAPVALVLGPTRELAEQVADELRRLAQLVPNTRVLTLCGGRARRRQEAALAQGAHIVVGTPGRVADHLRRGTLDVSELKLLVLDEADRMLDMGFVEEVAGVVDQCPPARQTLLFSATFPARIEALSAQTQRDPVAVRLDPVVSDRDLRQQVVRCASGDRYETVAALLAQHRPSSALVFCETRQDCDGLRKHLARLGASVIALHGGFEQRERDDALTLFSNGSARFLVATDVAARGLDIPELPMVVQAELAHDPQIHTHRIGRTARAGSQGIAIAVVAGSHEEARLASIEAAHGGSIPEAPAPPAGPLRFEPARFQTLLLLSGRKQKLRKGDVVGALVKDGGIPPAAIGDIQLAQTTCAVAIEREHARAALTYLRGGRVKKARVRVQLLEG